MIASESHILYFKIRTYVSFLANRLDVNIVEKI